MKQFVFKLSHDSEALEIWRQSALAKCLEWEPMSGSPAVMGDSCFHFFYPESIRGVLIADDDEGQVSLALGPFSSTDDIARVTELLNLALLNGIEIQMSDSEGIISYPAQAPSSSLLELFLPILTHPVRDQATGHALTQGDELFKAELKQACWLNHSEDGSNDADGNSDDDDVWVEIVDHTYAIALKRNLLARPQEEVESYMVKSVAEVMISSVPVMIKDYYEFWRPETGMISLAEYDGEACYLSRQCSHVDLAALSDHFAGKIIALGDFCQLLKDFHTLKAIGASVYIPTILGDGKLDIFKLLEAKAIELPQLTF